MKQTNQLCPKCQACMYEDGTCPFENEHEPTETARDGEECSPCSALVEMLEAEMGCAKRDIVRVEPGSDTEKWAEGYIAGLEKAIETIRSRSSTEKLSDCP
jgi:hypothetical protein